MRQIEIEYEGELLTRAVHLQSSQNTDVVKSIIFYYLDASD